MEEGLGEAMRCETSRGEACRGEACRGEASGEGWSECSLQVHLTSDIRHDGCEASRGEASRGEDSGNECIELAPPPESDDLDHKEK